MNRLDSSRSMSLMASVAKELVRPYYLKWVYSHLFANRYPSEFTRCWEYPGHRLDARLRECVGPGEEQSDVLFLPAADWHSRMQRSQHLATALAALGYRCFYLNPHLGREFPHPYPFSPHPVVSNLLPRVHELHVHLPREPVYHHRPLTRAESAIVVSAIEKCCDLAGKTPPAVVVSLPLWAPVAQILKERYGCRAIYDCHDLWSGFGRMHPDIVSSEADMFALSDAVVFSARWLLENKRALHDQLRYKSAIIQNAVEPRDFDFLNARNRSARKIVGYAGSLDFWFDVESVKLAAERHPEWEFRLLGRIESAEITQLGTLPNVRLIGEVPYSSLRQHFASVDVCMIPFRLSPLTLATNPLKLYEYFACGHPVVSTPLPEVLEFGDLVYVAREPREFTAQLEAAMAESDPFVRQRRRQVAEQETWTARCNLLLPHLQAKIPASHGSYAVALG